MFKTYAYPFIIYKKIKLSKIFTLKDLIVCGFNLKSHKFDRFYELYLSTFCEVDVNF